MKKIMNIGIGGRAFVIEEDAYHALRNYLEKFRRQAGSGYEAKEVMDDIEVRIAEIFADSLSSKQEVVGLSLVSKVIEILGLPDGGGAEEFSTDWGGYGYYNGEVPRKLFRDKEKGSIGGVCAGLSHYFKVDMMLIRVVMVLAFLFMSFGFWLYVIMWIIIPSAKSAVDKCAMYGVPANAENLRRFHNK